ncbi:MAG TPA: GIY-YIG nuclease family protein [Thermoanaerobaculia bacterium]
MRRFFWVYILASRSRTLYVGVTGNLDRRLEAHKGGWSAFTSHYRVNRLVHFEVFEWVWEAIAREKQIKRWRREKKVALVTRFNPEWRDLTEKLDEVRYGMLG